MESSFTWFESVSNEWGALRGGVVREKCVGLWERDYVLFTCQKIKRGTEEPVVEAWLGAYVSIFLYVLPRAVHSQ